MFGYMPKFEYFCNRFYIILYANGQIKDIRT